MQKQTQYMNVATCGQSRTDGRVIPHALGALGVHSVGSLTSRAGELRSAPTQRARQTDRCSAHGIRATSAVTWPMAADGRAACRARTGCAEEAKRAVSECARGERSRQGGRRAGRTTHLLACLLQASAGFVREVVNETNCRS